MFGMTMVERKNWWWFSVFYPKTTQGIEWAPRTQFDWILSLILTAAKSVSPDLASQLFAEIPYQCQ